MSVGMLELIKGLLCVGKCSNIELDIILFGDISMHINGSYSGPRFQKNLFVNCGKSMDTSQQESD